MTVVDFSCTHTWANENFHRVNDCLLPNWNLAEHALSLDPASTALLVPHALYVFYEEVFPKPWRRAMIRVESGECVQVRPGASVAYENRAAPGDELVESAARLRVYVWGRIGVQPERRSFVFIERIKIRRFAAGVRDTLRSQLHQDTDFVVYYGSESLADTVRLFSRASVVFQFHGAGATNMLWAPDGAALIELTLLIDPESARPWRGVGHLLVDAVPSMQWFLHGIPLSQGVDIGIIEKSIGVSPIPTALFEDYRAADMFLQTEQQEITIPKADLTNLAWMANTLHANRAAVWKYGGPSR